MRFIHTIRFFQLCILTSVTITGPQIYAQSSKTVLSVLAPLGVLDSYVVREFEIKNKIAVRVEMVSGNNEFAPKIKASPNLWDVVIADESVLTRLALTKLIKPHGIPQPSNISKLDTPAKINLEGAQYIHLMADPLGLVWKQGTVTSAESPSWNWLAQAELNPLWRNGTTIPYEWGVQYLIATKTTGGSPQDNPKKAFHWLKSAAKQTKSPHAQIEMNFLSNDIVAGALWRSDYLRILKFVRNLNFEVPKEGTFYSRIGAGIVAASRREEISKKFLAFLKEQQEVLAKYSGLTPVGFPGNGWDLFEDDRFLDLNLKANLEKIMATENKKSK